MRMLEIKEKLGYKIKKFAEFAVVAWNVLVMCKEKRLIHQWGRVIWFKLTKQKEVEEYLK